MFSTRKIMLKVKQFLFFSLCLVFISSTCSLHAAAAETPLAEIYTYNHSNVYDSGLYLTAIDNTGYNTPLDNFLTAAGYNTYVYSNVKAGPKSQSSVLRTLADDAIFIIHSHGGPGRNYCVSSSGITLLSAGTSSDSMAYSLQSNFKNTTNQLDNVLIAIFWGCSTYGTDSTYGSFNTMAPSLGVDCVITSSNTTYDKPGAYFLYKFAEYCNSGYTVSSSLSKAKTAAINFWTNGSTASAYYTAFEYVITGEVSSPGSIKAKPAGYGS